MECYRCEKIGHFARECPGDGIKSKIFVPREVKDCLFKESSNVIRSTRAECKATFIKYEHNSRQLVFGGSLAKKQKAMRVMYEKLEKMGVGFTGLWRAAHNLDSATGTEEDKDHEDNSKVSSFFAKKQNEELKEANKKLLKEIEELQKEKTSLAQENAELKRKIELPPILPAPKIKIKTEDGEEPCGCAENEELKRNLRDFQEKFARSQRLLKVREMELDILKSDDSVVQIE